MGSKLFLDISKSKMLKINVVSRPSLSIITALLARSRLIKTGEGLKEKPY